MTRTVDVYDPHLLYHAINITAELRYKVPMQSVYNILKIASKNNEKLTNKIKPEDVLKLIDALGTNLENTILSDDDFTDGDSLQNKIKELLRLLGCQLNDQELNKILKGELSIDDALSKQAKTMWLIIFEKDDNGRYRPDREIADYLLLCAQQHAIETVDVKIQRQMENYRIMSRNREREGYLLRSENMKIRSKEEREKYDPVLLDKKRAKLKLYIAHMQGYDRDRDRDGGRGVDMTTGNIIDFGDIYIADKEHGSFIDDIERDGIDMRDLH